MSSYGHVRSTQRGSRGLHFGGSGFARKPRGMNGISQRDVAQMPGSPRAARASSSRSRCRTPRSSRGGAAGRPARRRPPGPRRRAPALRGVLGRPWRPPSSRRSEDLMPLLRVLAGPDNAPGSRVRAFDFGDPGSVDVSALTVYDIREVCGGQRRRGRAVRLAAVARHHAHRLRRPPALPRHVPEAVRRQVLHWRRLPPRQGRVLPDRNPGPPCYTPLPCGTPSPGTTGSRGGWTTCST